MRDAVRRHPSVPVSDLDHLPEPRPIADLLDLMERLAVRCGAVDDAMQATAQFVEAFGLAVELRVPRMPDKDEELARMLEAAREGPTFSTEEVFESLERSRARSERLDARYRRHLAAGRTTEAAHMLVPGGECMLSWTADVAVTTSQQDRHFHAYAVSTHGTVQCTSSDEGLAMLGAVMRLHRYRGLWVR